MAANFTEEGPNFNEIKITAWQKATQLPSLGEYVERETPQAGKKTLDLKDIVPKKAVNFQREERPYH